MSSSSIFLKIYGNNLNLLRREAYHGELVYPLTRRASIKDIIEALGIPHTEIGKIFSGGQELNFEFIPTGHESIELFPFTHETPVTSLAILRPEPFSQIQFMVDINALKLARNLRMVGIDTSIVPDGEPYEIAEKAHVEKRILVTRNRDLLRLKCVVFGQLLRSENHMDQLAEVIERYALTSHMKPFTRCLTCNTLLHSVHKKDILHLLEPLTIKYYTTFKQCRLCSKIFWQGSHHQRMLKLVKSLIPISST